ncbi:MAG: hypothetical protein RLZZ324_927 [Candidatus Parcubacteria bacterium]|jgi:hypothetical protein
MENDSQFDQVLVAISSLKKGVDERFDNIDDRFAMMDDRFKDFGAKIADLSAACVTRGYLDQQMLDLRSDVTGQVRKGDLKVNALVELLHGRSVLTAADRAQLLSMGPFPQA